MYTMAFTTKLIMLLKMTTFHIEVAVVNSVHNAHVISILI